MKSYFGTYVQASAGNADSTVLVFDREIRVGFRAVDGSNQTIVWPVADSESQYLPALQQTRIRNARFPGAELLIDGKDADEFIRSLHAERSKPWYQRGSGKEWIRNTLLLLAILASLFLVYLLIVPWLSSKLASRVSVHTEKQLGDAVYNAMDLSLKEDSAAGMLLNEFFATMDVETAYDIRISGIREETVNAFALPGGRIVVYSALLKQLKTYPELAALLSHEFIHVNNKHTTRSIFRRLGSRVFIGLLFGRFGNVTAVLVDHADNLKSLSYSRSLEKEADLAGLGLLRQRKIDPAGFVALFQTLERSAPSGAAPEMLASHPNISRRIEYIRESSGQPDIEEDARLQAIFQKIKNR